MRSKPRREKTRLGEDANTVRAAIKGRGQAVGQEAYNAATPPTNLDFEKSLMFFHAYMYGPLQGKLRLYRARGIPHGSVAMPSDWEVFASMIVNDLGRKVGGGIDLTNNEVKSAKRPGGYEYQYHKRPRQTSEGHGSGSPFFRMARQPSRGGAALGARLADA
jgi:hypothetical protein